MGVNGERWGRVGRYVRDALGISRIEAALANGSLISPGFIIISFLEREKQCL